MKKYVLRILIFIMALGLFYNTPANAQEDLNILKDYKITKKTYFTTPLFEKVFPGTSFYMARLDFGNTITCFDIDGQEQNVNNKINTLIKKCQSTKYATIEEIIEAIIRLKFYSKDSSNYDVIITKADIKNTYWKEDTILYNYKIAIKNSSFPVSDNYYLKFDSINFINSSGSDGRGLFDFSDHSYIDEKIDDICVGINNHNALSDVVEGSRYVLLYAIVNSRIENQNKIILENLN